MFLQLQEVGLDLEFMFNSLIHEDVERSIEEHIHNFLDSCAKRAEVRVICSG